MRVYVTEKKDQVKKIAQFFNLKYDNSENVAKGKINGKDVVVVPLAGHIMRLYKPEEYVPELARLTWKTAIEKGYFPFIPKTFRKKVKTKEEGKQLIKDKNGKIKTIYTNYPKYFQVVKKYVEKTDEIVAAPDPDREGMTLFKEVIEHIGAMNKVIGYIKLNKLERKAVIKAVNDLKTDSHYLVMASSGEARGEYDWLFGINLSVAATVFLSKENNITIHVGGVKTPTLRMVVERDKEIEAFVPETFYSIKFLAEKDGKQITISTDIKEKDKRKVEELKKFFEDNVKTLEVVSFTKTEKEKEPPLPYTLTELASVVQKKYKIPINKVMEIAQRLYENEYQTYPRSDCNYYSTELFEEVPVIVENLFKNNPEYKKYESIIDTSLKRKCINDKEVDKKSHTALAPTTKYPSDIDPVSFKVYDTVVRRFLAQFAPNMKYHSISLKVKYNGPDGKEKYGTFKTTSIIDEGYLKIDKSTNEKLTKEDLPEIKKGDKLKVVKVIMDSTVTKPKPRFTESTLLDAMEKIYRFYDDPLIKKKLKEIGIGTQATRIGIIMSLLNEGYLMKEKGKIVSTPKGRAVIKYLPEEVSSPILRAKLEADLEDILNGKMTKKEFIEKNRQIIFDLFKKIEEKGEKYTLEKKPTAKQIEYAKALAQRNGVEYTKEMEESFDKTKEFIEKYSKTFSEYQKKVIQENAPEEIKELLKDEKNNYDKIKQWYVNFTKEKKYTLSEKQKNILEQNKDRLPKKILKLLEKEYLEKSEYFEISKAIGNLFKKSKSRNKKKK